MITPFALRRSGDQWHYRRCRAHERYQRQNDTGLTFAIDVQCDINTGMIMWRNSSRLTPLFSAPRRGAGGVLPRVSPILAVAD
jgi:hypothetical protein